MITKINDTFHLEGAPLVDGDAVVLKLSNGRLLPAQWYEDPVGRRAVFIKIACDDNTSFKSRLYLPENALVRRPG